MQAETLGRGVGSMLALFAPADKRPKAIRDSTAFRESAIGVGQGDRAYMEGLTNPDPLVVRKTLGIYDDMREDDALGAFLDMKKAARLSTKWHIEPASDSRHDMKLADHVEHALTRMQGSVKEDLLEIMSALDYGYSITNRPWSYIEDGPYKGKIGIKCLKTKRPHDFSFDTDDYYNIKPDGLLHMPEGNYEQEHLQVEEFIIYSYRMEFGNWYGRSDCRRAYRAWNSKRWIIRFWDSWLERFAGGWLDITYEGGSEHDHEKARKLITQQQSRTGYLHPSNFTAELKESTGVGGRSFNEAIQARDISMARTVLLPDLLGFSGKPTGSYALGKKHFDVFLWVLDSLGEDIEETIMLEQVIKPLIKLNYGLQDTYPAFKFKPLSDEQKFQIASQLITAIQYGAIKYDIEVENFLRGMFEMAEREEKEEKRAGGSPLYQPGEQPEDDSTGAGSPGAPGGPGGVGGAQPATGAPPNEPAQGSVIVAQQEPVGPARVMRKLTRFEEKVDFPTMTGAMNGLHEQFIAIQAQLYKVQQRSLVEWARKKRIVADKNTMAVNTMKLPRVLDMRKNLNRYLLAGFYSGALEAQKETNQVAKASEPIAYGSQYFAELDLARTPLDEVDKYFLSKGLVVGTWIKGSPADIKRLAIWITGAHQEKVLAEARMVLYKAINKQDINWAEAELKRLFDGYLQTGEVVDGALGTAHRIETIARTNFTTAFNEGRRRKFEDPELEEFIEAYQYSAVLDAATTPYCRAMDGRVIRKEQLNDKWPPAHFNCRSVVVPIVQGESYTFDEIPTGVSRAQGFEECSCCSYGFIPWLEQAQLCA